MTMTITRDNTATHNRKTPLQSRLGQLAITASLLVSALPAQAGSVGTITFSPANAAAIPALGGSLLVLLAALLALIAVRAHRRTGHGIAPILAGALALGSLVSMGGGIELMQRAYAQKITPYTIANPEGDTFSLQSSNTFQNDSGVPMVVSDISVIPGCTANGDSTPDPFCVDTTTAAGAKCEVSVVCD